MRAIILCLLLAACVTPQQRMKDCNADAQWLKGEARKDFLKECLRK